MVIHNRELLEHAVNFLKSKGKISVKEHLDEESFRPYSAGIAIRLNAENSHHVGEFLKLAEIAKWGIDKLTISLPSLM